MGRWIMTDKQKKLYEKAQLHQTRIELGVFGNYSDGGSAEHPNMPLNIRVGISNVDPQN
ncbi:MAG: hypothetical protein R6X35_00475 [Candidatus Krumholzibacteriia bacterium]